MRKSLGAQRVPRVIGGGDNEDTSVSLTSDSDGHNATQDSPLPAFARKRPSNKSRNSSSIRTSFGISNDDEDIDSGSSSVVTPRRTNLSKVAIQRNAATRLAAGVPFRHSRDDSEERQAYSSDALAALRQSTPSTPVALAQPEVEPYSGALGNEVIESSSKFDSALLRYSGTGAIPSEAEISEKKARRARLAKEQDFISLSAEASDEDLDDNVTRDDRGNLILKPKEKHAETRLVHDDEDIFENFDDFTSDGRIALGRNAEQAAAKQKRAEMAHLIADAEADSDKDDVLAEEDDEDLERNAAFDIAQTKSGTYASHQAEVESRPVTPPRITPLPTMDSVINRLKARLEDMQVAQTIKTQELEKLRAERAQILKDEERVQQALKDTAERYAMLRQELANKEAMSPAADLQMITTNHDGGSELRREAGLFSSDVELNGSSGINS